MYSKYVNATTKDEIMYSMFTRHTPSWALSCENSTQTSRSGIFQAFNATDLAWKPGTLLTVHLTSMILLALTAQCLVGSFCTGYRALAYKNNRRYFLIQVGTMGVLQIISIVFCYVYVDKQRSANEAQITRINQLKSVSTACPAYQLNTDAATQKVNHLNGILNHLRPISIASMVMILISFTLIILVCVFHVPSEDISHELEESEY